MNPRIRFDSEKVIHPGLTLYINSMIVMGLPLYQTQISQVKKITKKSANSLKKNTSSGGAKVQLPDPIGSFLCNFIKKTRNWRPLMLSRDPM